MSVLMCVRDLKFLLDLCCFSSDRLSWEKNFELLLDVTVHGEKNGFEVPCLLVAAKDDLGPQAAAISDSARVIKCS